MVNGLEWYVGKINNFEVLSKEESIELAKKAQSGDKKAREKLVNSSTRFVVKYAHQFSGYNVPIEDLIQEGNMGVIKAIDKFNPDFGYSFLTFAVWHIRSNINRYIHRNHFMVSFGTPNDRKMLFYKLRSLYNEMKYSGEADLSFAAIAKKLNVSEKNVREMSARMSYGDLSLNVPLKFDPDISHQDRLTCDAILADEECEINERDMMVRKELWAVLKSFDKRERYIIINRLMSTEPETLQEIGNRFAISRERIRQIEARLIKKLRDIYELSDLRPCAA